MKKNTDPNTPAHGEHARPHRHAGADHAPGEDRAAPRRHNHAHDHDHEAEHRTQTGPVITVRAVSGLSGDMMLSGFAVLAGLDSAELDLLVGELKLPALAGCVRLKPVFVNHIAGTGCEISLPHEHAHRTLADIGVIIADSDMPEEAKALSLKTFTILAEAEAAVHGRNRDEVSFHEVGALDSILDICLVCRLFLLAGPSRFVCSPLPLADGAIHCAHGCLPSPAPAVLRLLEGVPVCAFAGHGETVTPTAMALLKALGAEFGGWPAMSVRKTVISYGGKVFANAPNGAVWALGTASEADSRP